METLIFQLHAPLSSWGDVAVGEYRPTADYPSQSAIVGLLAAAFGIKREDEAAQIALNNGYKIAIGVLSQGRLLRDYQTAQVPSRADLKKRPHATRKDELAITKHDLNTILSTRDYRQDAASLVAVQVSKTAPYSLAELAKALKSPKFVLYLGRKSCPPAVPLYPLIMQTETIKQAFADYWQPLAPSFVNRQSRPLCLQKLVWGDDWLGDDVGIMGEQRQLSITRKDKVITRQGWQFGDRQEHIAVLAKDE